MGVQKTHGGRPIARGRRYFVWAVLLAVLCLLLVQFWAYERRWSSQHLGVRQSRKKFPAMLMNSWFVPENDNGVNESLHPRQEQPCENGADQRRIRALQNEVATLSNLLKQSTEFLELRDERESGLSDTDTGWFMSSLRGPQNSNGMPEEFEFPSELSRGRLLCLMGNNQRDGTKNKYGFAWGGHLPPNATLLPGLTLVADNYWDYDNIWHAMSALAGFVSWRARNGCAVPERVLLYHWGELVPDMCSWIENVLHASFGRKLEVETLEYVGSEGPVVCLERAVVNRRGLGSMSIPNLNSMFDTIRCRARKFCGTSSRGVATSRAVHVTLLLRTGARAFKNATAVRRVIDTVCEEIGNCHVEIAYASNLSFCEQVALMSRTDILVTTHGAQITNAMFMDKGSSVMEFVPKGWLEFAGVGQYIYTWLAEWADLNHEGVWRDPEGPDCPFPTEETLKCLLFHKDSTVSHNATHLTEWTQKVLGNFQRRELSIRSLSNNCTCDPVDSLLR